ncbi:hypothetical protein N7457_008146 [Penicillium paradoxum]|uniref:uncharacterized protein n=1 Tax=Penicillium paradoxum TaxID=176176 RepID=UPI002547966A|nr:uncharacterized protein N7457_008146 [Penicillium paradoxum]KAJ5773250.1 hypothetical protein N7457_008146 [Penicillium paradoxum]
MERTSNRCPLMMGSTRLEDPRDDEASWVTVDFESVMKYTHDDEKLMEFVIDQILSSEATIAPNAQHYLQPMCISVPVVGLIRTEDNENEILARAEKLATWWLGEIRAKRLRIDRKMIFCQKVQEIVIIQE